MSTITLVTLEALLFVSMSVHHEDNVKFVVTDYCAAVGTTIFAT